MENIRESFYADNSDHYKQLFAEMKDGSRKTPVLLQQRGAGLVDGLARLAVPVLVTEQQGKPAKDMLAVFETKPVTGGKKTVVKKKKAPVKRKPVKKPATRKQKGKGFSFPLFQK